MAGASPRVTSHVHRGHSSSGKGPEGPSSPLLAISRIVLLGALCAAPWAFGAVEPWAWGALAMLALLALVLWAAGAVHEGTLSLHLSPLLLPFALLLLFSVIQLGAGWTADRFASREAALKLVTDFVIFFLAGQLLNPQPGNGRATQRFGLVTLILALALCGLALAQTLWGSDPHLIYWKVAVPGWPFGPYVNRNNYAGLIEMLLPVSAGYLLGRRSSGFTGLLLWSGVGAILVSVWMSGSRGATLGLLAEGVVLAAVLVGARPGRSLQRLGLVLAAVALISGATFAWMAASGRVEGRAWSALNPNQPLEVKLGDRLWVSTDTLRMARSRPWTGVGLGCFEDLFPRFATHPTDLRWTHAHDDVAELVAEAGLPGAALFSLALALFLASAFQNLKERLRHRSGRIQVAAALGVAGLAIHSLLDFNLRIPANAAWFAACLAVATTHSSWGTGREAGFRTQNSGPHRKETG